MRQELPRLGYTVMNNGPVRGTGLSRCWPTQLCHDNVALTA